MTRWYPLLAARALSKLFGAICAAGVVVARTLSEFWIGAGLGSPNCMAVKNLACLERWIEIQRMEGHQLCCGVVVG